MSTKFLTRTTVYIMVSCPENRELWKNKIEEKIMISIWTFRIDITKYQVELFSKQLIISDRSLRERSGLEIPKWEPLVFKP